MRKNSAEANLGSARSMLLEWFGLNKRPLPWRQTNNPYHIWLSEIILQQTRVNQGLPYYLSFVENFPDIQSLANAPEQQVMRLWQGLGYYSRARNMHTAAKQLVNEFGGRFPAEYKNILKLNGVGEYTAAAIASIAFNEPQAVLDGNVYRVLSRLYADETPVNTSEAKIKYRQVAQIFLDKQQPGLFNEAMMELGATVCTPKNPLCGHCPLSHFCEAYYMGIMNELPKKLPKKASRDRYFHYLLIYNNGEICLKQRPAGDIWQSLYDMPLIENAEPGILSEEKINETHIWQVQKMLHVMQLKHQLTHQTLHINFYTAQANVPGCSFVPLAQIKNYALPKPVHFFLKQYFNNTKLF